jgi:N,N'-diacetyllegionaminate synthase
VVTRGDGAAAVIAEAGVNHNGDLKLALRLVDAAADAGADSVKFQSFRAEQLASGSAKMAAYQVENTRAEESQLAMLRRLELDEHAHRELVARCRERGIRFLSTPFDDESLALLVSLDVHAIKLSSGDLTNTPFLAAIARTGKPLILSTGMSTLDEVRQAVQAFQAAGGRDLTLLHCVTEYPAPADEVNLRAMETMRRAFECPVGYSDHTEGNEIAFAAAALGAVVIEKHFTLDRTLPGPDHRASLEPGELKALVRGVRAIGAAMGNGVKAPARSELQNRELVRKSLVARRALRAGDTLCREDIAIKRPGSGLPPGELERVIGKVIRRSIDADEVIRQGDV